MGSPQNMKPQTGLIRVPPDYPTFPTPGKLELLWATNEQSIYHRYSPYADYGNVLLNFGTRQPFIYAYIDEAGRGLNSLKKYESRIFPMGSGPQDVIRVTKYLTSGRGILFLGKQFLLQTGNVFNETRIYNPLSPIIAVSNNFLFGTVRPMRFIDIYGGIGGIAQSLLGGIGSTIFGNPATNPPPGTAPGALTPGPNTGIGGKGLLRAQTANTGRGLLEKAWTSPSQNKLSLLDGIKSWAIKTFANFIPATQNGITYKSDEGAYGLMIAGSDRFVYFGSKGIQYGFGQTWVAGANIMRKYGQYTNFPYKLIPYPDGTVYMQKDTSGGISETINLGGTTIGVGYIVAPSTIKSKPGVRYGDSIGTNVPTAGPYEASEIMLQYKEYVDSNQKYPTKKTDKKSVDAINTNLKKVLDSLKKSGVYQVSMPSDFRVLSSGNSLFNGYDRIFHATSGQPGVSPMNYPFGVLSAYRGVNVRMVDNSISEDPIQKSLKLPGAGNFDAINTLKIIPGDNSDNPRYIKFSQIPGWTKWEPYKDDQIAFYFYDIVNDKYIPFRATIKGIQESSNASWEELAFIGRADRLYSYGGFVRTLNFNFDVFINSIVELAPTWKRINYLMTLTKPSRYTKSKPTAISGKQLPYNRFMVPPMVLLTIGDLYKVQPIILQTVSTTIPDDAIWETLSAPLPGSTDQWSYLVDYIKSDKIKSDGLEYGQFPREAKLTITCYLLEKERAIMGAANFGHAPHTNDYQASDVGIYPYMHQALVEYQFDHDVTSTYVDDKKTIQSPIQTPTETQTPVPILTPSSLSIPFFTPGSAQSAVEAARSGFRGPTAGLFRGQ